jgi:hypothetical protein
MESSRIKICETRTATKVTKEEAVGPGSRPTKEKVVGPGNRPTKEEVVGPGSRPTKEEVVEPGTKRIWFHISLVTNYSERLCGFLTSV